MNCPNDRYVNDAAICQAVAAMLARIGVKINLMAETKVTYFPKILRRDTSLLPARLDAEHVRFAQRAVRADGDAGREAARVSSTSALQQPALDELAPQDRESETDETKRNAMIAEAFKIHSDDVGHLPLHQQALAWAHAEERRRWCSWPTTTTGSSGSS